MKLGPAFLTVGEAIEGFGRFQIFLLFAFTVMITSFAPIVKLSIFYKGRWSEELGGADVSTLVTWRDSMMFGGWILGLHIVVDRVAVSDLAPCMGHPSTHQCQENPSSTAKLRVLRAQILYKQQNCPVPLYAVTPPPAMPATAKSQKAVTHATTMRSPRGG